jgi:predicted nuclease of predicted toxin-antitoxin system
MKFLVENLSPLWVPFLTNQGFEAVHSSTVGQPWAPDSETLDFAATRSWIVFTHDLDFGMLLAAYKEERPKCNSDPFPRRASLRHRRNRGPRDSDR